ncbi:MAG: bifunctional phosphoribosylaminoimidazolecarboxamide formyltransferase/inosine monophosphate cyclohydrolase, partial [Deltaproteobacteria bacterium]
ENPHQKASIYSLEGIPFNEQLKKIQGKELSFNNILDIQAGIRIFSDFREPCSVVIKHNSPCGLSVDRNLIEAYRRAYKTDKISSFGGVVGFNRKVNKEVAEEVVRSGFREVVFAPSFTKGAINVFSQKSHLIVCEVKSNTKKLLWDMRQINGGFLLQERDTLICKSDLLKFPTFKKPNRKMLEELLFAFKVVKHLKSNAIAITKGKTTLGLCGGQPSRIDAVKIAIKKALNTRGAVLASDAFFPYSDSIEEAYRAGIKAVIQPGGSKKDKEVIEACNKYGIVMVFTGIRHFLH